jgi:hypothetical protein
MLFGLLFLIDVMSCEFNRKVCFFIIAVSLSTNLFFISFTSKENELRLSSDMIYNKEKRREREKKEKDEKNR